MSWHFNDSFGHCENYWWDHDGQLGAHALLGKTAMTGAHQQGRTATCKSKKQAFMPLSRPGTLTANQRSFSRPQIDGNRMVDFRSSWVSNEHTSMNCSNICNSRHDSAQSRDIRPYGQVFFLNQKMDILIEGSLEVKLPTIWTDEKQSRAEAERRERVEEKESEERRYRCAKR